MKQSAVRVLVVDDSAYIRKVVSQMLSRHPQIEVVGTARNGREALERVAELQPDVVTLDLMMPEMNGVAFLKAQMARQPLPVVVLSIASEEGERAVAALEAGALDFVQKPTALATEKVYEIERELVEKVLAAAQVHMERLPRPGAAASEARVFDAQRRFDIVVMGLSTGGPQALRAILPRLPANFPVPLAMVLHMPVGYTGPFARRLDEACALRVTVPFEGEVVQPGTAYLAEAGQHLVLRRALDGRVTAHHTLQPLNTLHRPAVDVLFQSAAQAYGARTLAVVMTGMGEDGLHGAAWVKSQGGVVIAEAAESAVVDGMPRVIREAGLADHVAPLSAIPDLLMDLV